MRKGGAPAEGLGSRPQTTPRKRNEIQCDGSAAACFCTEPGGRRGPTGGGWGPQEQDGKALASLREAWAWAGAPSLGLRPIPQNKGHRWEMLLGPSSETVTQAASASPPSPPESSVSRSAPSPIQRCPFSENGPFPSRNPGFNPECSILCPEISPSHLQI